MILVIDFNRWIYSNDIAVWLAQNASLTLEEQIDCIYAAPHRTLEEKLEGVKELKSEYDGNEFQDRIEIIERVLHNSQSDAVRDPYLFGIEVFYKGEKDCFLPDDVKAFIAAERSPKLSLSGLRKMPMPLWRSLNI